MPRDDDFRETKLLEEDIPFIQDELDNVTTIIYLVIEGVRNDPSILDPARARLSSSLYPDITPKLTVPVELLPSLVDYFVSITARLRWDEANELPQTRVRISSLK